MSNLHFTPKFPASEKPCEIHMQTNGTPIFVITRRSDYCLPSKQFTLYRVSAGNKVEKLGTADSPNNFINLIDQL